MVAPRVPKTAGKGVGKSFKGTMAYLLHDKDHATTDERVMWTETHNLATDDPNAAWRIMAATAKGANDIKRGYHEAQQMALPEEERTPYKATRSGTNHVFHYSLSWRGQDEAVGLTRNQMISAAKESLKELGGEHLQAVFVAHDDTENPHVHIMVNRVNPETGLMEKIDSNSQNRLRNWAIKHQRERGFEHLCPEREKRARLREEGYQVGSYKEPTRKQYEAEKGVHNLAQSDPALFKKTQTEDRAKDHALGRETAQMRSGHAQQWTKLSSDHKFRKAVINQEADDAKALSTRQINDKYVEKRREQMDVHAQRRTEFEDNEKTLRGKIRNVRAGLQSLLQQDKEDRGNILIESFGVLAREGKRRRTFEAGIERDKRQLAREQRGEISDQHKSIEQTRKDAIHANYERYNGDKRNLEARQQDDRTANKQAWDARDEDRTATWREFGEKIRLRGEAKASFDDVKGEPYREVEDSGDAMRTTAHLSPIEAAKRGEMSEEFNDVEEKVMERSPDFAKPESPVEAAKAAAKASKSGDNARDDFKEAGKDAPKPPTRNID